MSLERKVYSVLIASASESFNNALFSMLPASAYGPVRVATSASAAKRMLAEDAFDFLLINAPLPDELGTRLAFDAAQTSSTVVLLMARAEYLTEVEEKSVKNGVFTLRKPTSKQMLLTALCWLASARERLRKFEKKTLTIEEKMAEIRLVNKAKWILISELHMTEPEAHRYLEKQAMDRCIARREVAEEIIKIYT